jgi:hypothetical protein
MFSSQLPLPPPSPSHSPKSSSGGGKLGQLGGKAPPGYGPVGKADSEHLCALIMDCMTRLNLNINLARGQGYDGASVMSGGRNGVAAKVTAIEPRAMYIHCAAHVHSLNLTHLTVVSTPCEMRWT